jgi:hypothetical protein
MLICDVATPCVCPSCHRAFSHRWMFPVRSEAYEKQRVCGACYQRGRRAAKRHKQRFCQACGLGFVATRADARYCSARCRQRAHRSAAKKAAADGETPRMTAHEA